MIPRQFFPYIVPQIYSALSFLTRARVEVSHMSQRGCTLAMAVESSEFSLGIVAYAVVSSSSMCRLLTLIVGGQTAILAISSSSGAPVVLVLIAL